MQASRQYLVLGSITSLLAFGSIVNAPAGSADCTDAGGVTVCAQGSVRGSLGSPDELVGPVYPYPCDYDYLCHDGGVSIALDPDRPDNPPPDFGRPGRPDIGAPGRPGGGGNAGAGGGGGRGGGGGGIGR